MKRPLFLKKIIQHWDVYLILFFIIVSFVIISYILYFGIEIPVGLWGALIGVPFLAWQSRTSHKALHETKDNNQNTQKNNDKTQEAKMYIDCITQLANEKETIRTAAIHGLHELIKNTKEDSLKEKIFNILWSFMVEHSTEWISKISEIECFEDSQKTLELEQKEIKIEKFYSQFKIILQILAYYKDKNQSDWWKDKSMRHIWLHGINLPHIVLEKSELTSAKLEGANLTSTNLQNADLQFSNLKFANLQDTNLKFANLKNAKLQFAKLQSADLQFAELQSADLRGADLRNIYYNEKTLFTNSYYNSKRWTDPNTKEIYQPTKFPENFDPKAHGMIDVSEQKS